VISTSRIVSAGKKSVIGAPTFASGDKINRPDASSTETELDRAAKHSFRLDARAVCSFESPAVRQLRTWERERNFVADLVICGARKRSGASCRCRRLLRKP
jgi:hypothetical protein